MTPPIDPNFVSPTGQRVNPRYSVKPTAAAQDFSVLDSASTPAETAAVCASAEKAERVRKALSVLDSLEQSRALLDVAIAERE